MVLHGHPWSSMVCFLVRDPASGSSSMDSLGNRFQEAWTASSETNLEGYVYCLIGDSKRIGGKKCSCTTVSLRIVPLFLASCFCLHQTALWQMRTCPHMNSTLHEKDGVLRCMREHQTYRIIQSFDSNSKQHKPCKRSWSPPLVRQSRFDFDLKATIRVPSSKVKQKKCGMVMCHHFAKTSSWPSFTIQLFVEPCGISRVLTTAQTDTAPSYDLPEFCSLLATCFDVSCRISIIIPGIPAFSNPNLSNSWRRRARPCWSQKHVKSATAALGYTCFTCSWYE